MIFSAISSHAWLTRLLKRSLLLGAVTVSTANCFFLLKHDKDQCSTDQDCTSRGAAFEGTFCQMETSTCRSSLEFCRTNAECVERNGGQNFICHKDTNTCHPLTSRECPNIYMSGPEDVLNDNTVFIGAILVPGLHQGTKAADLTLELVRRDFQRVGFLPGVDDGPRRPVAIVSCDPPPPRDMRATTDHLVTNVKPAAIIAPLESERVGAVLELTIPAKVPVISPIGNSSLLDNIPNRKDLFYQVCPTDGFLLTRGVRMIDKFFEPKLRDADPPIVGPSEPLKIALLRDATNAGASTEEAYLSSVQLNGKDLLANASEGNFKIFNIGDPAGSDFNARLAEAIAGINDFAPHFILVGGTAGGTAEAIARVEQNWGEAAYRPHWLSNDTIVLDPVINQVKADPTLRSRLAVVAFGPKKTDPALTRYYLQYDGLFASDLEAEKSVLSSATYDATYLTFYAIASLGNEPLTPEAVGLGFRKVTDPAGVAIAAGDRGINEAFTAFTQGRAIRFSGTWGTPSFNEAGSNVSGEAPIFCIDPAFTPAIEESGISVNANGDVSLPTNDPCNF